MKGYTNSKGNTSNEIVNINIIGVNNPTFVVSYSGITTTYTGNITLFIPDGIRYTITFNEINGYITPKPITYTAEKGNLRNINVEYIYNPIIDLSMLDIYGNPIALTTANCYVIKETGTYKLPLVFGNAIKNGTTNSAAYTKNNSNYSKDFVDYKGTKITSPYIETVSGIVNGVQLSISDTDNVFVNMNIIGGTECKYLQFEVASVPDTGANGIISIKDSSGVIMWNWHIWVWPYDLTPVEITNATGVTYNILPVNLATKLDTADSVNKTTGWKNWFYQFGRPTPLICNSNYYSKTIHNSYGVLNYSVAITSDIQNGILNPTLYYMHDYMNNIYNWFNSGDNYYNLWDAACTSSGCSDNNIVKTVYDPCPIGFKVPNGNTFTGFYDSETPVAVGSFLNGYFFKKNSLDTIGIFFPKTGYIQDLRVSDGGFLWTAAVISGLFSYYLNFSLYGQCYMNAKNRANCYSIRPVQE